MPKTNWNVETIDGQEYLVIDDAQFRVPKGAPPEPFTVVAPPSYMEPWVIKGDAAPSPGAIPHEDSLHECSKLWVTPEFIWATEGWSWWSNPLDRGISEGIFVGRFFVYEAAGIKKVWRVIEEDLQRSMLLGKWPD